MAPSFAACRICYRIEGKLKNYKEGDFYESTYEKLTGCTFEELPWINKFCPHCACLMRKLYKFVKMCRASYYQLTEYLNNGRKVTQLYVNHNQDWRQRYHPIHLTCGKAQRMEVVDCIHTPKKSKTKMKTDSKLYVWHLTVPKDESAEVTQAKPPDDYVQTNERQLHMDQDNKEYLESPIDNVEGYIDDFVDSDTIQARDVPVENEMETMVENEGAMTEVLCVEETKAVKNEEFQEQIVEDTVEEQNETDVKPERDEDMTLQEIKEELQAATILDDVDFEIVEKKKKVKRNKKEPKSSKHTQQQLLRAKRLKVNQELEEHFSITYFLSPEQQWAEFLARRQAEGHLQGRYQCRLCLTSFKGRQWMEQHVRKHEPAAGDYECSICKIRCKTPKLFRTHRDANHTTKFTCKRCPFVTYSKAQALKHHGWHEGVEHTCQHCGATFRKHTTYMGHLRRAHPSSFICGACARSFVSAYGLNLHIKAVHKDIDKLESDSTKCEECDVTFVSRKMYVRHVLITDKHKEIARDILGCRKCGEQFATRELLEQHTHYKERRARAEVPKRAIKCDECDEVFSHPNGVYQHYLRSHPDKPYQFAVQRHYLCEQCGKTYKSPGLLQQHSLVHKGIRPPPAKKQQGRNSCRICGKTYSKLSGLFRHKLTHQGVRRHKCHICEKAFTDTSNLKQHVQGVHLNIRRVRKR
ncbi:uncharacterized protein isoform X2 [Choristoneura fumiferana]|uniref:uncharacterized protein isoform X2 n=1 Tax=Choristoneura fumiferana TaxID=7141 RepID=UPI003D154316